MTSPTALPPFLANRAFSVAEALSAGLSVSRLRCADLLRPFHGVRAPKHQKTQSHSGSPPFYGKELTRHVERCELYLPVLGANQFFSHQSAAAIWGIPLPPRAFAQAGEVELLHITSFAPTERPRRAGVRGRQTRDRNVRVQQLHGIPVCDPLSVWLQLAATTQRGERPGLLPAFSLADLVAVGDYLLRWHPLTGGALCTLETMRERVREYRGRGKRRLVEALRLVRPGSESRMESLLRVQLHEWGLPEPELNVSIVDAAGAFIARGDLVFARFGILVEYDGEHHRIDTAQYRKDVQRQRALARAGWTLIRVLHDGLTRNKAALLRDLQDTFRAAGWDRASAGAAGRRAVAGHSPPHTAQA